MALEGQLGFKSESVVGTAVTVDKFHVGWLNGNPQVEQASLMSKGVRAGRRTPTCVSAGFRKVTGSVSTELNPVPLATLLRHMYGTIGTSGAGPYVHTASLGSLTGQAMTMQFGIPGTAGTTHAFTMRGCKLPGWTLKATAGEIATLDLDVLAMDYVTNTALASASYTSSCPFTFIQGSISVAGVTLAEVKSFELSRSTPLRDYPYIGSSALREPLEMGMSDLQIKVDTEFTDLTLHNLENTTVANVLTFNNGTDTLVITNSIFVNPSTPQHSGVDGLPTFELSGFCKGSTDAAASTAVLTNTEASSA